MTRRSRVWEQVECLQDIHVQGGLSSSLLTSVSVSSSFRLEGGPYETQDSFLKG